MTIDTNSINANSNTPLGIEYGGTGVSGFDGAGILYGNCNISSTVTFVSSGTGTTLQNSGQPAFFWGISSSGGQTDVTGDGTVYTVVFDHQEFDQTSMFNGTDGNVGSPARYYFIQANVTVNGLTSAHTSAQLSILEGGSSGHPTAFYIVNPYALSVSGAASLSVSCLVNGASYILGAGFSITVQVSGGSKVVGTANGNSSNPRYSSFVQGWLVC